LFIIEILAFVKFFGLINELDLSFGIEEEISF